MANRERGEIDLTIADQTYTLVLDTNAMVALEEAFSTATREVTFDQVLARVTTGSVRHIRGFLWAALRRHHRDLTLDAVGDLIQAAGGLSGLTAQIERLMGATQPDPQDLKALGGDGRPRAAQGARRRGAGGISSGTPAASA